MYEETNLQVWFLCHKTFKEKFGLRITMDPSAQIVNFLDVTLDLENGKYKPFRKPNDTPLYVNTGSSHPQTVLKQIPHGINKRLVEISSSETDFNEAKPAYQKALNESKHKHTLEFKQEEPIRPRNNNKKKRRIFWFNPPFSAAVTTNIGKQFLALVDKHFPKTNPLHAIFNRNTMKLSYSFTMNVKAIIQAHNKKLLNKTKKRPNHPTATVKNV